MICFIRGRTKIIKVEKQFLLLNYAFVKKKKYLIKLQFWTKKILRLRFLECAERHVFRLSKITVFQGVFVFFLTKKSPIFTAFKQMILDEIRQLIGIKPPKIMILCKFLPHKGHFCWKLPSKVIYTFYLKHQKYPFCAPIFHLLYETESNTKSQF